MTKLLNKAIEAAAKLPPEQQDALATLVLDEIASERRWDDAFAKSQDVLAALAKEALEEHAAGQSTPLNQDSDFKGH
ncbi:MAG: hypothetical protein OER43_18565 [Gammaproteobacteria bacterium]|nr:hypothetical protein [Gammaproteobacteria bacterium]MDH3413599.1 hypothetical protein [Gammaproteobacteria bacterium]